MSKHYSLNDTEYWVYNDSSKLPVIIMIHGLRGTHHGLDLVAKQLSEYRAIVPDLPGFNNSKPLACEHSIENYSNWLKKFIIDLNLPEPPILLGHSFGSIIVSKFASQNPKLISDLILVNPVGAPALNGPRTFISKLAVFYYWLGNILPEGIGTRLLKSKTIVMLVSVFLAKTKDKKTRKYIHGQHLKYFSTFTNRKTLIEAYKTSIKNDVRMFAKNISVPTLLIAGDKDDVTKLDDQKSLCKLFPNAELKIIYDVGHITQYETPDQVAGAIKKFTN